MASASKRGEQMQEKTTAKCTLFVRNLPYDATNEGLEEVFSEVGPIKTCFVVKDKGVADKCRGFGFVTYADRGDAEKATTTAHSLDGRKLQVKYADKKTPNKFGNKKKQNDTPGADKTSPTKHSFFKEANDDDDDSTPSKKANQKRTQTPQKSPQNQAGQRANKKPPPVGSLNGKAGDSKQTPNKKGNKSQSNTIQQFNKKEATSPKLNKKAGQQKGKDSTPEFKPSQERRIAANEKTGRLVIRNLSFKCKEDGLREAFSSYGEINEVKIPRTPGKGKGVMHSRGFGFVQFKEKDGAAAAVKNMNGKEIMGRQVAVDWSLPQAKFLAAKKAATGSPKTEKPKPKESSSSGEEESDDDDESEEEDSDDDDDDDDESEDDESNDEQETKSTKQAGDKSVKAVKAAVKRKHDEDSSEGSEEDDEDDSDDESDDDDEEQEQEQVKKTTTPGKSNKASVSNSKPAVDEDSSSDDDDDDDSGNGEDDDSSESDSSDETRTAGAKQDSDSGSIPGDESSSEEEDEDDSDEEDEDDDDSGDDDESGSDDEEEEGGKRKKEEPMKPSDVGEGKTLFVRNVPFESTDDDLRELFSKFGRLEVCRVVMDKDTEHSKGSAFVKYASKEEAEKCLRKASSQKQDEKFTLDGRRLEVSMALPRNDIEGMRKALKKQEKSVNKDKRNLYLLREGLVREGTEAAKDVSEADMAKRTKVETIKRNKLKNINIFISPTRMVVHNLPKSIDDAKLKKIFLEAAVDKKAKVTEARVMRDMKRPNADGKCPPLGFAFVEFTEHEHALAALRHVNNNQTYFGENKRPIVGFSLENKTALEAKKKRLGKMQSKGAQQNEQRDRAKTGPSQSEVAKKTHVASLGKDQIHTAPKTKIRKGLPSHMGPKKRWRDKGKLPPPKKDKSRVSRAKKQQFEEREPKQEQILKSPAGEQETGKNKKRRRKNADRQEESNFNKIVAQYKNKLFADVDRTDSPRKQPKSKWFDNS